MSIEQINLKEQPRRRSKEHILYRVYTARGIVPGFLKESKVNRGIEAGSIKDVIHIEAITSFNETS